jgi:hypothetical protein
VGAVVKHTRNYHVTDPTVGPWADASLISRAFVNKVRPLTTHADLIAAAAHRGECVSQPFIKIKEDAVFCPDRCGGCMQWDEEAQTSFLFHRQQELDDYKVQWDPTICF